MKAIVFHGIGDIRLDDVDDPVLQEPTDAIVEITKSAICGTDLHLVRGTMPGVAPGTILGHEGVGVVREVGSAVRSFVPGDRVVVCSTISCGYCVYCRAGYTSQCDNANPNGPGTAFFGGPESAGGFHGLQAEYARIPFASNTLVRLPDEVDDEQAIILSDIFPTGYFGADMANIHPGETVAVMGAGPVGQCAVVSAFLMGAGRVFCVDHVESRLQAARRRGAEIIDFDDSDAVDTLRELTGGIGPDRIIDAVGVDSECSQADGRYEEELDEIAPDRASGTAYQPGNAPTAAIEWAVEAIAKAGTLAVVGVYSPSVRWFPLGKTMMKNLKLAMGNCPHRRYMPGLVEMARTGAIDPRNVIEQSRDLAAGTTAYEAFDQRQAGWLKVALRT